MAVIIYPGPHAMTFGGTPWIHCAVQSVLRASPGVAVRGHPSNACVGPLEAAGQTSCLARPAEGHGTRLPA